MSEEKKKKENNIKYATIIHCSVCMCIQFNNSTAGGGGWKKNKTHNNMEQGKATLS